MVRELEDRYGDRVQFRYPDFYNAANRQLVERFLVRGHPTTVAVRADGTVAQRISGLMKPSTYIKAIEGVAS